MINRKLRRAEESVNEKIRRLFLCKMPDPSQVVPALQSSPTCTTCLLSIGFGRSCLRRLLRQSPSPRGADSQEAGHVSHLPLDWSDPYSSFSLVHLEGKTLLVHTPFLACFFSMLSRVPGHSSKLWLQKHVESECGCPVGRDSKSGGESGVGREGPSRHN